MPISKCTSDQRSCPSVLLPDVLAPCSGELADRHHQCLFESPPMVHIFDQAAHLRFASMDETFKPQHDEAIGARGLPREEEATSSAELNDDLPAQTT